MFVGPLAENDILSRAEHLFKSEIRGPESLIHHKGCYSINVTARC